jgi:hypothetical protein
MITIQPLIYGVALQRTYLCLTSQKWASNWCAIFFLSSNCGPLFGNDILQDGGFNTTGQWHGSCWYKMRLCPVLLLPLLVIIHSYVNFTLVMLLSWLWFGRRSYIYVFRFCSYIRRSTNLCIDIFLMLLLMLAVAACISSTWKQDSAESTWFLVPLS